MDKFHKIFLECVLSSYMINIVFQIQIHGGDYCSLHQHIPAAILPEEYGGDQPSMDNRPFFESLLDSEEYFENLMTFGYGKISDNRSDCI